MCFFAGRYALRMLGFNLVIVAFVVGATSIMPNPSVPPSHVAVVAAPRTDEGILDRQALCIKRAKESAPAPIVFVGDSITQAWEDPGAQVWKDSFAPMGAVNLGVSGDRTEHVLWRLQEAPLTRLQPKAVVLLIGTNNLGHGTSNATQTLEGTVKVIETIRTQVPEATIIACATFPRGEQFNTMRGDILQINQAVARRFASDDHVVCLDLGVKFLNPDGSIPAALMPDSLHLTPAAYAIWAAGIREVFAKLK